MDSFQAVTDLGHEVKERGFKALKTNIIFFDDDNLGYGYGFGTGAMDQTITPALLGTSRNTSARSRRPSGRMSRLRLTLTSTSNRKPQSRYVPFSNSST